LWVVAEMVVMLADLQLFIQVVAVAEVAVQFM
jgi:hypothetical protein